MLTFWLKNNINRQYKKVFAFFLISIIKFVIKKITIMELSLICHNLVSCPFMHISYM
jgi:hypothetical protein